MENIETAILLMVVGMATVFVILLIVIYLGKLLITLVNKYAPEEVIPAKKEALQGPAPIPGNIMAAITAAVNVVRKRKDYKSRKVINLSKVYHRKT
jgi:oxaloacetate decarboxylase gamma subunit